jgi:hypothetical protein
MQSLTYVEIDIPAFTQNSPPDSPPIETTLRFAVPTAYLPGDIEAIPSIKEVMLTPAVISLGGNLGQRATLAVSFQDHRHVFAGEDFASGTFWGKFRARYGVTLQGRPIRLIRGLLGQALAEMETRHFIIESSEGPTPQGEFKFVGKDILKLLDGDRALAPRFSNGFLVAAITSGDTAATLSPAGIGDTEYPASGHVAIGGSEIGFFTRDPFTKLLLNFEGADGATSTTDETFLHTVTFVGSAQIDTAQAKFGASAVLLGAAGNYLDIADSADWALGTGPFTLDQATRFTSVPAGAPNGTNDVVLFWQEVDANNRIFVGFDGTDLIFLAVAGGVTVARYTVAHGMSNNVWHHWRFVRSGSSFFIFRDGVSLSLTATTPIGSNAMPDIAAPLRIGGQAIPGPDWADGFVWRKGVADTVVNFTPPTAAPALIGSGDALALIGRGQLGTAAAAHNAQDRVQLVLRYASVDPADIIRDLLVTYADVPAAYIPLTAWQLETATFLSRVYTATIAEPTAVAALIAELIEQAALVMWWDDATERIGLQVLHAILTDADRFTDDTMLANSFGIKEQPDKRISQVATYFGQINPLRPLTDTDNYRSTAVTFDPVALAQFGTLAIKKILSRWIPALGRTVADRVNAIQLGRFREPPRLFDFALLRYSGSTPSPGRGYRLQGWPLQDVTGARIDVPVQLTRLNATADRYELQAEEMQFNVPAADLANRQIIIDANINNVNLRSAHDSLYPPIADGESPKPTVTCTINAGVIVGSSSIATPAFDVGSWPAGVTIVVIVRGRLEGMGGHGGAGGSSFTEHPHDEGPADFSGFPGEVGGIALLARYATSLDVAGGEIWGGGGGGAGGTAAGSGTSVNGGGGGGGGAGQLGGVPGAGGVGLGAPDGSPGQVGTPTAGGPGGAPGGGSATAGATGGGPGLVGGDVPGFYPAFGGAPGAAIDGVSFVTITAGPGDRRGPEIN